MSEGKAKMSTREKVLIAVAAVAIAAAVVGAVAYFLNAVPSNAAAKYNDSKYVYEEEVTEYIDTFRTNYSMKDDDTFSSYLSNAGLSVSEFRENAIDEIITRALVKDRANVLGLTVSDQEVEDYYNTMKGDNDTSEGSIWASVLESAGLTEQDLKDRYRYLILQDKVLAKDVEQRDATDDEVLSYIQYYLPNTTQMQISHIVFSGDGAKERAQACYESLKSNASLDSATFAEAAVANSNESDVAQTKGVIGWTGCGKFSDGLISALSDDENDEIVKGYLLAPVESTEGEGTYEVAYVNDTFSFSGAADATSLSSLNVPSELLDIIRTNTTAAVWQSECSSHLSKMLADAGVVYYSMPSNASYNVS